MSEEFKQQSKAFLLGFIIVIGVSVVSAWNGPASTALNSNTDGPINVSATPQAKGTSVMQNNPPLLDIGGILASNALAVWGDATIQGDVTLGKQATSTSATNRRLCVDSTGKIILCGQQNFAYTTPGNYTFTVPSGVNTIIVELYGGGGAGFSDYHTIMGSSYKNTDGSATSFVHSTDSSKANLIAYGGKTPTSASTGGNGGSYSTTGSQVVSADTTNSAGPSGNSPSNPSSQSYLCKVTNGTYNGWELWLGSAGSDGGSGGGTGSGAGGAGGTPRTTDASGNNLTSSFCSNSTLVSNLANASILATINTNSNYFKTLSSSTKYPSTNASDGSGAGSGGGGAGGIAGFSAFDTYTSAANGAYNTSTGENGLCNGDNGSGTYNKPLCIGQKGKPGGGAGGYIKAKLSVTPGDSYTITVGTGGKADYYGTYWIASYNPNGSANYTGVNSGKGAPGAVNITYN